MKSSELEKRKQAIWRECEQRWHSQFSEKTRAEVEKDKLGGVYEEEDLDSLKSYLEDASPILKDVIANSHNRQPDNDNALPRKRYPRSFEKRLHLVTFVADRKQSGRIDWQHLAAEWNKEHPYDPMTPAVLKVEYHRAKGQDKVMQAEFAKRRHPQYAPQIKEFALHAKVISLAEEQMWTELGRIELFKGYPAVAGTVTVTQIALNQAEATKGGIT